MTVLIHIVFLAIVCFSEASSSGDCTTAFPECSQQGHCDALNADGCETPALWIEPQHCSCNTTCLNYGDCCHGNVLQDTSTVSCTVVDNIFDVYPLPIYIINKCPITWLDKTISDQCTNSHNEVFGNWPVVDSNSRIYRNSYCAFCNGVADYLYFESNIQCINSVDLKEQDTTRFPSLISDYVRRNICKIQFKPLNNTNPIHYCKPYISTCEEGWEERTTLTTLDPSCVRSQCEEGSLVRNVYSSVKQEIYKNYACAVCNNAELDASCEDNVTALLYPSASRVTFHPDPPQVYPLSIVFDLNMGLGTHKEIHVAQGKFVYNTTVSATKSCPAKHVYDPFVNECRTITCSQGFIYSKNKCTPLKPQAINRSAQLNEVCPTVITLSQEEFVLYENETLYEILSGKLHLPEFYDISSDQSSAQICTYLSQNYTYNETVTETQVMFTFSEVQTYISVAGQVISIIALIVHLIIYAILPPLRNLPGCNLMCLSISLLVAQILFLVGTGRTEIGAVCVAFGLLMHYFFLAAFFWMNIMSFDLYITFSQNHFFDTRDESRRCFFRYSAYAWLVPGLIVMASFLTYSMLNITNEFNPAYGHGICWVVHKPALIIFFGAPLALILLCNLILYIFTIYNIKQVSKSSKLLRGNQSDRGHLMVYTKLCVIMGLTWIFGFIATLGQIAFLWYVFLVFNSLQGLFICLTFVCTRKVIKLLREKGHRKSLYEDGTTKSTYTSRLRLSLSSDPNAKVNISPVLTRASYRAN